MLVADLQKRWRMVKLWFDVKPRVFWDYPEYEYDSYDEWEPTTIIPVPIRRHCLFTENLSQLEELSINYAALYPISATSKSSEPGTLPSLMRLTIEMAEDYGRLAQWFKVAPNVKEVNLTFYSGLSEWVSYESAIAGHL